MTFQFCGLIFSESTVSNSACFRHKSRMSIFGSWDSWDHKSS